MALLSEKGDKFKPRRELTKQYMSWVSRKLLTDPMLFSQYKKNKGIIHLRNLFLAEEQMLPNHNSSVSWGSLIEQARIEVAAEKEKHTHNILSSPSPSIGATKSNTFEPLLVPSPYASILPSGTAAATLDSSSLQKILIIPVSIIALGKSTLGAAFKELFPNHVGHIESDDTKGRKGFLHHIIQLLKKWNVVYADRCHQTETHRADVIDVFKKEYPDGKVVALEWQVGGMTKLAVADLATKRISKRYHVFFFECTFILNEYKEEKTTSQ